MAHWFNPILLSKLLLQVIVSGVFGQYADRRLIVAALDIVPDHELVARADISDVAKPDSEGAVWIDYAADLGDGFDATYAVASLLGQDTLSVDSLSLPRGCALILGGDEVYPTADRASYLKRMIEPYSWANPDVGVSTPPLLLALPGNHDWYDGLVTFLAFFARKKSTRIGQWRTRQRRSYFAVKLSELCWLWAIDVALVEDMDQPQADYFVAIAHAMTQGSNIILCSAEPGWYKAEEDSESYRTLSYAANIAQNAGRALKIPLVLSGDTHHYSRYSTQKGTQYITSGGAGAFLHGTHHLPDTIKADWLGDSNSILSLKTDPGRGHAATETRAVWPRDRESKRLLYWNLIFPILNWDFAIFLGALYTFFVFAITSLPRVDVAVVVLAVLVAGFVGYSGYQEKWKRRSVVAGLVEALIQFVAILGFAAVATSLVPIHSTLNWWLWLLLLSVFVVPIGGLIGSFLFGLKLFVTCRWFNLNHNDAFSAIRLYDYRHFLRIKILGDEITVYAIGLRRVPRRGEWRKTEGGVPRLSPERPLAPELIERPIVISALGIATTQAIKKPDQLKAP